MSEDDGRIEVQIHDEDGFLLWKGSPPFHSGQYEIHLWEIGFPLIVLIDIPRSEEPK